MSTMVGLLLLALQLTGLTSHLPAGLRNSLVSWAIPAAPSSASHLPAPVTYTALAMPLTSTGSSSFALGAKAALAVDTASGAVLFEKNSTDQRPIASITKLMTTLVILSRHSLDETVTIPPLPSYAPDAAQIHLVAGEQLSLRSVLAATLIPSANDAADALAIWDAGTTVAFTERMNALATSWGIGGTHFTSASGLVDDNNYATAASLVRMAGLALSNSTVRSLVMTSQKTIQATNGHSYTLATTNQLLKDARFSGIKTGYTPAAGESVVALASVNGHSVITVILGSPDRFGETTRLINYLEGSVLWQ